MPEMHEALFYNRLKGKIVQCCLCRRQCAIDDGETGKCGVRKNVEGKLYSLVYGRTLTMSIDPIEKKPLFHFKPGSQCMGVSTYGCNFFCLHCQNWQISQQRSEQAIAAVPFTSPKEIVEQALGAGVEGIAYTYTEPTVFAEYALDTMKLARKKGLYNVWVSNGYMSKECIDAVAPFLDAINVDLKGNALFYRDVCGSVKIEFIKENIAYLHKKKIRMEITNLIVLGYNDKERDFREVAEFIAGLSPLVPVHFTRFWPMHKMPHLPPTDAGKLYRAREIALEKGLKYVYTGNLGQEESTKCPKCNSTLIKRSGFSAKPLGLENAGKCKKCHFKTGIML
ncbi:MAG: AmmeMemoRadiSam system radical SAM enzyme [Candidatus Diapherotrites archaeon]|uniref:AmmeMemoRadiSam system radical SAM enzyme n=1 Tax=Candidatus Iainarchaeum sp. TaxID=3101447 RepID=A0A939C7I1_9ARCH|nr:AmmeMemoRadiSam system radical SAM enzyme [Candidatus Diapherotrites archaeon]